MKIVSFMYEILKILVLSKVKGARCTYESITHSAMTLV